jgi:sirohydrochlorin cobaltochelatase
MHRGRHLRPLFGAKSVDAALLEMARLGVSRVAVQSLHVVAGGEFTQVVEGARRARKGGRVRGSGRGRPAASGSAGRRRRGRDDSGQPAPGTHAGRGRGGHGARGPGAGPGDLRGPGGELSRRDALVFFSTLDRTREDAARPDSNIGRLREAVLRSGARRAWLVPFFQRGRGPRPRDLAGDEDHSWRGVLSRAGSSAFRP